MVERPRRRKADESDAAGGMGLEGLPHWLRAAVMLGVPSVIALFLVYALVAQFGARIGGIETEQAGQTRVMEFLGKAIEERQAEVRVNREYFDRRMDALERLVRYNCLQTARDESQKANCVRGEP